jgi:TPR repeat protein
MGGRAEYLQWLLNEQQAPVAVARPGAAPSHAPAPVNGRLLQAARQGDAQARVELGIQAATRREYTEAQRWFRSATGSRAAAINLQRVDEMARVSQRTAAPNTSRAEALFDQAQKLHRGQGVPANYAEAIRLYRQAAQMGHGPARAMLELIFSRPGLNGQVNLIWMQQLAYVDTRQSLPRIAPSTVQPQLVRDPTPLFDLMPAFWQRQVPAAGI